MFEPSLTRNIHRPNSEKIAVYLAHGGYEAAKLALSKPPEELIEMVKRSGLRGRTGRVSRPASNGALCPKAASPKLGVLGGFARENHCDHKKQQNQSF